MVELRPSLHLEHVKNMIQSLKVQMTHFTTPDSPDSHVVDHDYQVG